ncbi:hypothetical protein H8959_016064 [Pygathrix nigripes]
MKARVVWEPGEGMAKALCPPLSLEECLWILLWHELVIGLTPAVTPLLLARDQEQLPTPRARRLKDSVLEGLQGWPRLSDRATRAAIASAVPTETVAHVL